MGLIRRALPSRPIVGNIGSERWCVPGWLAYSNVQYAVVAGTIYYLPMTIDRPGLTFDRIGVRVNTAGAAGTLGRLAIYRAHPSTLLPDALIADYGTIPTDASNTDEVITISWRPAPGLYWMASVFDGTPTVRGNGSGTAAIAPLTSLTTAIASSSAITYSVSGQSARVAGGFPTTAVAPTAQATDSPGRLRVAA